MRFLVEQLFFLLSVLAQVCSLLCSAACPRRAAIVYGDTQVWPRPRSSRISRGSQSGRLGAYAKLPSFRVASKVAVAVAQLVRSARDLRRAAVPQRRRVLLHWWRWCPTGSWEDRTVRVVECMASTRLPSTCQCSRDVIVALIGAETANHGRSWAQWYSRFSKKYSSIFALFVLWIQSYY